MFNSSILAIIILVVASTGSPVGRNPVGVESSPTNSVNPYVEQLVLSFTQNLTSVAFNVTAVEQCGSDGFGPAYLVNGLSDKGFWYQAGLAWNFPNRYFNGSFLGFSAVFEAFSSNGTSFYFLGGRGSLVFREAGFSQGDLVLLRLSFTGEGNVSMSVHDWNSDATARTSYSAFGATYFVGSPSAPASSHGFFTGLMTEQYHLSPYQGDEQIVTYKASGPPLSSAWMQIDEYQPPDRTSSLFNYYTLASYTDPARFQNFTSNGAFEASNANEFITGQAATGPTCAPFSLSGYWRFLPPVVGMVAVVVLGVILLRLRKQTANPSPGAPEPGMGCCRHRCNSRRLNVSVSLTKAMGSPSRRTSMQLTSGSPNFSQNTF